MEQSRQFRDITGTHFYVSFEIIDNGHKYGKSRYVVHVRVLKYLFLQLTLVVDAHWNELPFCWRIHRSRNVSFPLFARIQSLTGFVTGKRLKCHP